MIEVCTARREFTLRAWYLGHCVDVTGIPPEFWLSPGLLPLVGARVNRDNNVFPPGRGVLVQGSVSAVVSPCPFDWEEIEPGRRQAVEIGLAHWRSPDLFNDSPRCMFECCNETLERAGWKEPLEKYIDRDTGEVNWAMTFESTRVDDDLDLRQVDRGESDFYMDDKFKALRLLDQCWWSWFDEVPTGPETHYDLPVSHYEQLTWLQLKPSVLLAELDAERESAA